MRARVQPANADVFPAVACLRDSRKYVCVRRLARVLRDLKESTSWHCFRPSGLLILSYMM